MNKSEQFPFSVGEIQVRKEDFQVVTGVGYFNRKTVERFPLSDVNTDLTVVAQQAPIEADRFQIYQTLQGVISVDQRQINVQQPLRTSAIYFIDATFMPIAEYWEKYGSSTDWYRGELNIGVRNGTHVPIITRNGREDFIRTDINDFQIISTKEPLPESS